LGPAQGIEAEIPQDPPEAGSRNWSGKPGPAPQARDAPKSDDEFVETPLDFFAEAVLLYLQHPLGWDMLWKRRKPWQSMRRLFRKPLTLPSLFPFRYPWLIVF
jgi:hypothetical protein